MAPGETHTYQITAIDHHGNVSDAATISATAASANTTEPRQVGVRPHGSYWGTAGEQIDLRSGNLNFTLPLLKAIGRTGWGVTFALSYNSQMWRQDSAGTWNVGKDVGYGMGWRLLAGSITPVYSGTWNVHHYIYTDATGAEYGLDQNSGGMWYTKEGLYLRFNADARSLDFPDGSRWFMNAQSAGEEEDAGTMYPTSIQDTNGNYLTIEYSAGYGVGAANSSGRITFIKDMRGWLVQNHDSYRFTYSSDPIPHLTEIRSMVGTAESYTFAYQNSQALYSPFSSSTALGVTSLLESVTTKGLNVGTSFLYGSGTAEMTQMTTPMGGRLYWTSR